MHAWHLEVEQEPKMLSTSISIALIVLLAAASPGPDFALVLKNSLVHSKRSGCITALGIASAVLVHITYLILGLDVLIKKFPWIFQCVQYLGAGYLIYLGIRVWRAPIQIPNLNAGAIKTQISFKQSFLQGFLCNLLNPKAALFFMALFAGLLDEKPKTYELLFYVTEIFALVNLWFCSLSYAVTHKIILKKLFGLEKQINQLLGLVLIIAAVLIILY